VDVLVLGQLERGALRVNICQNFFSLQIVAIHRVNMICLCFLSISDRLFRATTFVDLAQYQFKYVTFSMPIRTLFSSKIVDIPSSPQLRPFTVYTTQHTSWIGRVSAAHSSRCSISHRDILIRRTAFKYTKPPSHR
jgi:hypothetical protein